MFKNGNNTSNNNYHSNNNSVFQGPPLSSSNRNGGCDDDVSQYGPNRSRSTTTFSPEPRHHRHEQQQGQQQQQIQRQEILEQREFPTHQQRHQQLHLRQEAVAREEKFFVGHYAEQMEFYTFCRFILEAILRKERPTDQILGDLFLDIANVDQTVYSMKYPDFFSFLRLLCPDCDRERCVYNLDERKVADIYLDILAVGKKNSPEAIKFANWKGANHHHFSDTVTEVLKDRGTIETRRFLPPSNPNRYLPIKKLAYQISDDVDRAGRYTVADANRDLDEIYKAGTNIEDKKKVFRRQLIEMQDTFTTLEHRWFVRILLQKMKMDCGWQSVLRVFAPTAVHDYNASSDLREVSIVSFLNRKNEVLLTGKMDTSDLQSSSARSGCIRLFSPFYPMLAGLCDTEQMADLLKRKQYISEPKYDGERMMIHVFFSVVRNEQTGQGGELRMDTAYTSRNRNSFNHTYQRKFDEILKHRLKLWAVKVDQECKNGDLKVTVATTNDINNNNNNNRTFQADLDKTSCILDGEFLVYDASEKRYVPFGQNRSFGASTNNQLTARDILAGKSEFWFCYQVFDIVFLNGHSLCDLALKKRKEILKAVIDPLPTMLEVNLGEPVTRMREAFEALERAVEKNQEGIVLKNLDSPYTLAERKLNWIKLKAENIEGLMDSVDAVVLGGYYGTKFHEQGITHFLLGVWAGGRRDDGTFADTITVVNHANTGGDLTLETVPSSPDHPSAKFITIGKVGSGYSRDQLKGIKMQLAENWEMNASGNGGCDSSVLCSMFSFSSNSRGANVLADLQKLKTDRLSGRAPLPSWLFPWKPKSIKDVPDVFVKDPSKSVVLKIGGFCFVPTDKFALGQTMRFPKCLEVCASSSSSSSPGSYALDSATDFLNLERILKVSNFQKRLNELFRDDAGDDNRRLSPLPRVMTAKVRQRQAMQPQQQPHPRGDNDDFDGKNGTANANNSSSSNNGVKQKYQLAERTGLPWQMNYRLVDAVVPDHHHQQQQQQNQIQNQIQQHQNLPFQGATVCVLGFNADKFPKISVPETAITTTIKNLQNNVWNWSSRRDIEKAFFMFGGVAKCVSIAHASVDFVFANTTSNTSVQSWISAMSSPSNSSRSTSTPASTMLMSEKFRAYKTKDIMSLEWARRCLMAGRLLPPLPHDVLFAKSDRMQKYLSSNFDEYDDGFYEPATINSLARSMKLAGSEIFYCVTTTTKNSGTGGGGGTGIRHESELLQRIRQNPHKAAIEARRKFEQLIIDDEGEMAGKKVIN